jgi:formate-dependent nitrite reductase membrane component NrfD
MSSHSYGRVLFAGLLFITLGLIFLIENLHTPLSLWRLIWRFFLLLVIFFGIRKIYEYFRWKEIPPMPDQVQSKE